MIYFSNQSRAEAIIKSVPAERKDFFREKIELIQGDSLVPVDIRYVRRNLSSLVNGLEGENHKFKVYEESIEDDLEASILKITQTYFSFFFDKLSQIGEANSKIQTKKISLIYIHEKVQNDGSIVFYPRVVKIYKPPFVYDTAYKDHLIFVINTLFNEDRIVASGFATKGLGEEHQHIIRQRVPVKFTWSPNKEKSLIDLLYKQPPEVRAHFSAVLCLVFFTSSNPHNITLSGSGIRKLLNMPKKKHIENSEPQEYVVLPYYFSGDLRNYLKENEKNLLISQKLKMARSLIEGVKILISLGRLHGDLKPENLLIDDEGKLLLHDYETNINFTDGEKWRGQGNLHYIAPELWVESTRMVVDDEYSIELVVGPEIDLFVVGCVLHEIFLNQEHPYLILRKKFYSEIEQFLDCDRKTYAKISDFNELQIAVLNHTVDEAFVEMKKKEAVKYIQEFFLDPYDGETELKTPVEGPFGNLIDRLVDLNPQTRLKEIDEVLRIFGEIENQLVEDKVTE